jgi:hypothetical protein
MSAGRQLVIVRSTGALTHRLGPGILAEGIECI